MKYRIWDTINKEYIKDYVIHNDEIVRLNKITKCLGHLQYIDEFTVSTKNGEFTYVDGAIKQENTGYVDKNGVEVFVGDIVSYIYGNFRFGEYGKPTEIDKTVGTGEVFTTPWDNNILIDKKYQFYITDAIEIEVIGSVNK